MGARSILIALRSAINATPPITWPDKTFRCHDGTRNTSPRAWIESPSRQLRDCDLSWETLPAQADGPCKLRGELAIRIAYRLEGPEDVRTAMVAEDIGRIAKYVVRDPSQWGGADTLWNIDPPTVEDIDDESGRPATTVVTIPLMVVYSED